MSNEVRFSSSSVQDEANTLWEGIKNAQKNKGRISYKVGFCKTNEDLKQVVNYVKDLGDLSVVDEIELIATHQITEISPLFEFTGVTSLTLSKLIISDKDLKGLDKLTRLQSLNLRMSFSLSEEQIRQNLPVSVEEVILPNGKTIFKEEGRPPLRKEKPEEEKKENPVPLNQDISEIREEGAADPSQKSLLDRFMGFLGGVSQREDR